MVWRMRQLRANLGIRHRPACSGHLSTVMDPSRDQCYAAAGVRLGTSIFGQAEECVFVKSVNFVGVAGAMTALVGKQNPST